MSTKWNEIQKSEYRGIRRNILVWVELDYNTVTSKAKYLVTLKTAGFISGYFLLNFWVLSLKFLGTFSYDFFFFFCQRLHISQLRFDAGASFCIFYFEVLFFKRGCLHYSFVIRLESRLPQMSLWLYIYIYIYIERERESNLILVEPHFRSNGHNFNRDAWFTVIDIIEKHRSK